MKVKLAAITLLISSFCLFLQAESSALFIQAIKNATEHSCLVGRNGAPAGEHVRLRQALEIPYVSIKKYLREYASKRAYTPEEALKIVTPIGLYRLWASESGVMCARDPKELKMSFDNWKAKTLIDAHQKLVGKNAYLTLAFAVLKGKFKISLEPARS